LKSFQKAVIGWKKADPPKKTLLFRLLACLHDQTKADFWRAGFFPANPQSFLKTFQIALIG